MTKRAVALLLICLFCLSLCGCEKEQNDKIIVGVNLELTGRLAQYGNSCLEGIEIAAEEINANGGINGKKVLLKVRDNSSQSSLAALVSLKLAEKDGACAVLGPSISAMVKAVLENGCDLPIITPSATADSLTETESAATNIFRVCYTDSQQGKALGWFAAALGFRRVSFLIDRSSDYSMGISQAFEETFIKAGGEIVAREYYTAADTDFTPVLTVLKQTPSDAIFLPGYYTEAGMIIKQARRLGITAAVLSGDAFDSPALPDITGDPSYLDGVYFSNHYFAQGSTHPFVKAYENRYGKPPAAYCALGYDSGMLLFDAIARAGSDDPVQIRQALHNTENFQGVTGSIRIGPDGNAQKDAVLLTYRDGKCVLVK